MSAVISDFRQAYGIVVRWIHPDGRPVKVGRNAGRLDAERLPALNRMRAHALEESVRWGEPYSFFLAPGLVSWMVPAVRGEQLVAGVTGTVLSDDDDDTRRDAERHLAALGAKVSVVRTFVAGLPVWPHRKTQEAINELFVMVYRTTGWQPTELTANRERAAQQRQIAEEIQRRKLAQDYGHPVDEEKRLLAQIRAGDRKGARGSLNSLLGVMFLSSPNPVIIKARAIELLGYLVRAAVENSPQLEPLIEKNHRWTAALIEAREFEELTHVLGRALDDFMDNIYLLGSSAGNAPVRRALGYIADHYREGIALSDVAKSAGLSAYRTAHLLKETTGHSFLQHVHRLRIDAARRLLEKGGVSGAEAAYAVGYNDQSYFIRHFRRLAGVTPARYAKGFRGG